VKNSRVVLRKDCSSAFDFVYAFDVATFCDLHTFWNILNIIKNSIRPGGKAFFSFVCITRPGGWSCFRSQQTSGIGKYNFYWPDIVFHMFKEAQLHVCKSNSCENFNNANANANFYSDRDLLVVVQLSKL